MKLQDAIKEIQQSRSKFQIEKFVLGQHDTPEMQYYQLCIEAGGLIESIEEADLKIQKLHAEIDELRATGKKSDEIEAQIKELRIRSLETGMIGTKRELAYMEELFEQYEHYTREQIEAAQPDYWKQRLMRVGEMQMLAAQGGVNWAQLEALYQADALEIALEEMPQFQHITDKPTKLLTAKVVREKIND